MWAHAFLLGASVLASASFADQGWLKSLQAARDVSAREGKPILADFSAVWCYSCYYMERNVLGGERFADAAKGLVLLKLDVDREEGLALKKKYGVSFLPSFLVLDAAGAELGRIVGEQTQKDFLDQLGRLAGRSRDPRVERLRSLIESGNLDEALKLRAQAGSPLLSARLDLRLAQKAKDPEGAAKAMDEILMLEKDCPLAYDVERAQELVAGLGKDRAEALWRRQQAALEGLVERKVFGKDEERCADARSEVEALGAVYARLDMEKGRWTLLKRTIDLLNAMSAAKGVGNDRNLDDNLRYFLEAASRDAELEGYYPKLMAAYPSDYVYAYRFAKRLKFLGRNAEALPLAERAYALSYGANRLQVGRLRAEVLASLGRKDEAVSLLKTEVKANRARFPAETAGLEALLGEWRK